MRPIFNHFPRRPITKAQMHMWGQMMAKRDMPEFLSRISNVALTPLASVDDHVFVVLGYMYVRID